MTEEIIQKFINNFNRDITDDTYAFLKDLYENCVGPEVSNEFEQKCMTELEILVDKLYKSFTKQQRDLFNRFDKLKNKMQNNAEQQLFIYGFCTAKLLDKIGSTTNR